MIRVIMRAFKRFAWFKRLNAKVTYELLAKRISAEEWQFMNYGYIPNKHEPPVSLPDDPKIQKYPMQMYHYLAAKTPLKGKQVLEVGSGRGGGARYVAGSFQPASYTGMDIAQSAVDLANKIHQLPNLRFIQGSAENIPLADNSMDVVLNVESCHAYGSVDKLLSEAWRSGEAFVYIRHLEFFYNPVLPRGFENNAWDFVLSWCTILFELSFVVLIWNRHTRIAAIIIGVIFNLFIWIVLSIPDFALLMILSFVIFLKDEDCLKV